MYKHFVKTWFGFKRWKMNPCSLVPLPAPALRARHRAPLKDYRDVMRGVHGNGRGSLEDLWQHMRNPISL